MQRALWMGGLVLALSTVAAEAQVFYFTGTAGDQIWVANRDGSGVPSVVVPSATGDLRGPIGIEWGIPLGELFYAGGQQEAAYHAADDGGGSPAAFSGTSQGDYVLDVAVDVAGNRLFFSVKDDGVYGCTLPCTSATHLEMSGTMPGLEYDPASDLLYWTESAGVIARMPADGSALPELLYDSSDGVQDDAPRNLVLDPANGRLYWAQHDDGSSGSGEIRGGNMDGSGTTDLLFTVPADYLPFGMEIDSAAGELYWTEFDANDTDSNDRIMHGSVAGSGAGAAQVLFSGNFGSVRGVSFGAALAPSVLEIPTLSGVATVLVVLLLGVAGVLRLRSA